MDQIVQWLDRHDVTATTLLITVVLLIAAAIVIFLLKRLLQNWLRGVEARLGLPYEAVLTVTRIASGALWVITVLLVLEIWGIGVGGLWTLLVSAATLVGVGFLATWTMVSNITASLFIMIWRPFRLGDRVEILPENLKGRVVDRDLMFVVCARKPARRSAFRTTCSFKRCSECRIASHPRSKRSNPWQPGPAGTCRRNDPTGLVTRCTGLPTASRSAAVPTHQRQM